VTPAKEQRTCQIEVIAFDSDNQRFSKTYKVAYSQPLEDVRQRWARLFSIPENVVGFEDKRDYLVDLKRSPADLGWDSTVELQAVPLQEEWADKASLLQQGTTPHRLSHPQGATKKSPAPVSADAGAARAAAPAPQEKRVEKRKMQEKSTEQKAAKRQETEKKKPETKADKKADAAQEKKPQKILATLSGKGVNTTAPVDDEAILFDQSNPKRADTASYIRYERYKKGKTPREALRMGAERGDIANDFKKGFLRRKP